LKSFTHLKIFFIFLNLKIKKSLFTVDEHATHCENASPVGNTVEYRPRKPRIVCGTIPRHESASGIDSSRSARINAGH
jgi:hypothetical protein